MNFLEIAQQDKSFTLKDSVNGFGTVITITDPNLFVETVTGRTNDISFAIDPNTPMGQSLRHVAENIYQSNVDLNQLWSATVNALTDLDKKDRIAYFNAKKFLCFQLAKLLDTLQYPFRSTYQSLVNELM